jgi:DNA repair exonuclease SbcCD ATPase subunit
VQIQQAFATLATSVNRTVTEVRATMELQFEDIAVSERIARNLMARIADTIQHHRQDVAATLQSSRQQLRVLAEMLNRCQMGAADLARLNQTVNHHIGGMVMALQCQDITRQKIEHVGEAMTEMRTHLEDPDEAAAHQFVFQAGQIQLQQVQGVFNQLNEAAESLKSGISGLHGEAGAAAEAVVKVGATTLEAGVAKLCQAGISEILHRVQESVLKFAEILEAFKPLQASFVDCTGKATTLAGDVRHAGLNAQVFAIHAPEGATLEVLAGRVRVISEEVIQHVEDMRMALNDTAAMIDNLRQRLEDFQVLARAEEEVLSTEAALSQQKLAELETTIPGLIAEVTRQQAAFANIVKEALAHVQFPKTVAEASARSLSFFKDLVAWSGAADQGLEPTSATSRKLDRLKSSYTMAAERDLHEATLRAVPDSEPATAAPSGGELFDDWQADPPNAAVPPPTPETLPTPVSVPVAASPAPPGGLGENVELF